jgi:hypothetical protein
VIANFPTLRQPLGSNSCLPTAVCAILRWLDTDVTLDEVSEWCSEDPEGCILDIAIAGLSDAGIEMEELNAPTDAEREALVRLTVTDEENAQPILVTLQNPLLMTTGDHAVVLLGIRSVQVESNSYEIVEYMDPLSGEIKQDITGIFWEYWAFAGQRAFIIRP